MLCCAFICVAFLRLPAKRRSTNLGLVAMLAFSNGAYALKFFATGVMALATDAAPEPSTAAGVPLPCKLLGGFGQLTGMLSLAYSGAIALNLWCSLAAPLSYRPGKYSKSLHGVPWVMAVGTTAVGFVLDSYGPSGDASCWIVDEFATLRLAAFFIPLYIVGVVAIAAVCRLAYTLRRQSPGQVMTGRSGGEGSNRRGLVRAGAFVGAFLASWAGSSLLRMWELGDTPPPEAFVIFSTAANTAKGILDAIIWRGSVGNKKAGNSRRGEHSRGRYMQLRG